MELRKDILKISKKSRFRIIMGMGFFLIAIFWVADRAFEYHDIRPFDWLYFSFFIFSGIIHPYEGFGYSFSKLFDPANKGGSYSDGQGKRDFCVHLMDRLNS